MNELLDIVTFGKLITILFKIFVYLNLFFDIDYFPKFFRKEIFMFVTINIVFNVIQLSLIESLLIDICDLMQRIVVIF